jgi:ATP-binding cassette subfamily B protein
MFVALGIQMLPPLIMGFIVNIIGSDTLTKEEQSLRIIIVAVSFIIALGLGNLVVYYQSILLQKIGQQTVVELRNEVFNHIEHLSIGQINQVPVGKLVTRVTNDTNTIGEMYTNVAVNLIRNVLFLFAVLIALFIISPKITLYVVLTIPFVFAATV